MGQLSQANFSINLTTGAPNGACYLKSHSNSLVHDGDIPSSIDVPIQPPFQILYTFFDSYLEFLTATSSHSPEDLVRGQGPRAAYHFVIALN